MCSLHPNLTHPDALNGPAGAGVPTSASPGALGANRPERPRASRRKLWDVPHKYHCPIIGTCLHVDELRQIARKAQAALDRSLSDYEVHVSFVSVAEQKHPLTIGAHKALERKHAASVRLFARARDVDELRRLWREALAEGRVPGALWALMTHPKTDQSLRTLAFEEVHMLSHQVGAGRITDARLLADTRAELARVREDTRRLKTALAERDRRVGALEARLVQHRLLERELKDTRVRIARLESDDVLAHQMAALADARSDLAELRLSEERAREQAERWRERWAEGRAELEQVSAELEESRSACGLLERLLAEETRGGCGCPEDGCEGCPGGTCRSCPDLGGRRILCVGGRSSLTGHYRAIVGRCNGELIHHDGGIEDSRQRLEALLAAADAVVCPADCVSHDAYLRAKRYCKRTAKPCVLLKSSGVVSFARALEQVAA